MLRRAMADREPISTDAAPEAIGPYSQAIRSGGFLFCSGQVPLDPSSGELVKLDVAGPGTALPREPGRRLRARPAPRSPTPCA